jgi:hypothetical protein
MVPRPEQFLGRAWKRIDRPLAQEGVMETVVRNRTLARVAGAVGIIGQVAAAYVFLLYPALTVPSPANYVFFVAWVVLVGLAITWWRSHPWRSFLVPITSVPVAGLLLAAGTQYLGWRP